jgi:hypothetical protein
MDWEEEDSSSSSALKYRNNGGWMGAGREFSIFESRGGSSANNNTKRSSSSSDKDEFLERYRQRSRYAAPLNNDKSTSNQYGYKNYPTGTSTSTPGRQQRARPEIFQTVQEWWSTSMAPNFQNLPKIVCRIEPTTTLKLRKTFRPLKTIIRLGADFNTQLGVWQFQSSWEDAIIGGKLTLAGKELQLTKSWQLSVGKGIYIVVLYMKMTFIAEYY